MLPPLCSAGAVCRAAALLAACQTAFKMKSEKMIRSNLTRWRTHHGAAVCVNRNKKPLLKLFNIDRAAKLQKNKILPQGEKLVMMELSDEEWAISKQMEATLALSAAASTTLEGREYVTASLVLPLIAGVMAGLSPGEQTGV